MAIRRPNEGSARTSDDPPKLDTKVLREHPPYKIGLEGIESHVVDPASIAVSRRRRRAKTDRIDGEATLLSDALTQDSETAPEVT